jgi:hypothetical protein
MTGLSRGLDVFHPASDDYAGRFPELYRRRLPLSLRRWL